MNIWRRFLLPLGLVLLAGAGALWGGHASTRAAAEEEILLSDEGVYTSAAGVCVEEGVVQITSPGVYALSGQMSQGQIHVYVEDGDEVTLLLRGVELTNAEGPAIYLENAARFFIVLEEGSTNCVQSGSEAAQTDDEDAEGAAIYARDDLTLSGGGALRVLGYLNNGLQTSNRLNIEGGSYEIYAQNHGIKGKDSVTISGGSFSIEAGGDGVQSNDESGEGYGAVSISGGSFSIASGGDGVQAQTLLEISGGDFSLRCGGGAEAGRGEASSWDAPDANWDMEDGGSGSMKGLKSAGEITISGGTFVIDAEDDAVHADGSVYIRGGELELSTGDDGVHADTSLDIEGGEINILTSYEGLEAEQIHISGGSTSIVATDDGVNANGGAARWGRGAVEAADESAETPNLRVSGGEIYIDAGGDGLDSNGNLYIEGGLVLIDGPSDSWNGAIDSGSENGGACAVSGGTILALGSAGMAEGFDERSEQCSLAHAFEEEIESGAQIVISDAEGNVLFESVSQKRFSHIVFSSPELELGETIFLSAGDQSAEIELASIATTSGARGGQGFRSRGFGRPRGGT